MVVLPQLKRVIREGWFRFLRQEALTPRDCDPEAPTGRYSTRCYLHLSDSRCMDTECSETQCCSYTLTPKYWPETQTSCVQEPLRIVLRVTYLFVPVRRASQCCAAAVALKGGFKPKDADKFVVVTQRPKYGGPITAFCSVGIVTGMTPEEGQNFMSSDQYLCHSICTVLY